MQGAFDGAVFELGEVLDLPPDRIVANQRALIRGTASGAALDWSYWLVMSFRNGKAVRSEWFTDRADALEAAGVSE